MHCYDAQRGSRAVIHRAIRRYGRDAFSVEPLIFYEDPEFCLRILEPFFIKKLGTQNRRTGYNLCAGGRGISGMRLSDDHKKKISQSLKGKPSKNIGRKHSAEHKRRLSEALRKRWAQPGFSADHSGHSKRIVQYTIDLQKVAEFSSLREATRITGIYGQNIGFCASGRCCSAGGFVWAYEGREPKNPKTWVDPRKKAVIQLSLSGTEVAQYPSAREAANTIGIHESCISNQIAGRLKSAGGFLWRYAT